MDPSGKIVIITGASAGIGAATARIFAAAGARVVLAARDSARLEEVACDLPGALVIPTDMANEHAIENLVARVGETFGGIDILISNAGVGLASPIATLKASDLRQVFEVNLLGPLALTQAVLPYMQRQGRGQLIYISSVVGLRALPYLGGYAASKAALDRLTESLRVELRGSRIAVTLVRPGTTRTEFSQKRLGHGHERRRISPRGVAPEQVAAAILHAARREPRIAYVTWGDRLATWMSLIAPGIADRILARAFSWEEPD